MASSQAKENCPGTAGIVLASEEEGTPSASEGPSGGLTTARNLTGARSKAASFGLAAHTVNISAP